MAQRMIQDSFWTDSYIEKLSPDEKLIYLYLLTNPLCNIAGIYEIRSKRMAFDTGFDTQVIDNILDRLVNDNKIQRFNDWIYIRNFVKNQSTNPKVLAGIDRILRNLPQDAVACFFGTLPEGINANNRSTVNFSKALDRDQKCVLCNSIENLQVDHIQPLFNGGTNELENLQVLCKECHLKKTGDDFREFGKSGGIGYRTLLNSTLLNSTLPTDGFSEKNQVPKIPKPQKPLGTYGTAENVYLTDENSQKLIDTYGFSPTKQLIEDLSLYMASKGKRYKNHYFTLLRWARDNKLPIEKKKAAPQIPMTLTPEDYEATKQRLEKMKPTFLK